MRHRARSRKLGRSSAHRKAMYRNLVTSLLEHERVETTDAKAKEVRRVAERMITLGKRGDLHARRRAMTVIRRREVAAKVFDDLAERYRDRAGGYTRVLKLGHRVGDSAAISVVELVDRVETVGSLAEKPAKSGGDAAPAKKKKSRKAAAADSDKKPRARKATGKKASSTKAPTKKESAAKAPAKRKSTRRKSD